MIPPIYWTDEQACDRQAQLFSVLCYKLTSACRV